jgi:type IV pilus assembly protein PilM
MSLLTSISRLVMDPPPSHLFELSEAGLSYAHAGDIGFQPFEPGLLTVSPVENNLLRADLATSIIEKIAPSAGAKKRRPAVVILPDYAARVSILDFDSFPANPDEQLSLIRFRIKKTIPFEIDSAAVSYFVQPASGKKIEVVAVTVALEVIARYEALFRNTGFHPGVVTTSALAALNLYQGDGVGVLAKLAGHVITVLVIAGGAIKLFRCVMLEEVNEDEILAVLHPTLAYIEDELGTPARKLILCGFPNGIPGDVPCEVEPLRSRHGVPGAHNAGLLGYLEVTGA